MADVFISYKTQRRRAAEHLKRIIEAHGFSVWYDARGLMSGPDFGPQIEREIRAAKCVLVLWCGLSRESQWVREEADLAKELGTYAPVLIEAGQRPPLGFTRDQHIDLTGWTGAPREAGRLDALLDAIERLAGRPSMIDRAALVRIDEDWRLYGAPDMIAFALEAADDEARATRRRFVTAPASLPEAEGNPAQPGRASDVADAGESPSSSGDRRWSDTSAATSNSLRAALA